MSFGEATETGDLGWEAGLRRVEVGRGAGLKPPRLKQILRSAAVLRGGKIGRNWSFRFKLRYGGTRSV